MAQTEKGWRRAEGAARFCVTDLLDRTELALRSQQLSHNSSLSYSNYQIPTPKQTFMIMPPYEPFTAIQTRERHPGLNSVSKKRPRSPSLESTSRNRSPPLHLLGSKSVRTPVKSRSNVLVDPFTTSTMGPPKALHNQQNKVRIARSSLVRNAQKTHPLTSSE